MDLNHKKAQVVVANQYATRLDEKDLEGQSGNQIPGDSVDSRLLELLKSLNLVSADSTSFPKLLASSIDNISYDLRIAHHYIANRDGLGLDRLAQQLTQNALKVGAVNILSSAIEIQGLARIGDFAAAEKLLGDLEVELHFVREQLA